MYAGLKSNFVMCKYKKLRTVMRITRFGPAEKAIKLHKKQM